MEQNPLLIVTKKQAETIAAKEQQIQRIKNIIELFYRSNGTISPNESLAEINNILK
jgi:predicted RNA methylase